MLTFDYMTGAVTLSMHLVALLENLKLFRFAFNLTNVFY